MTCGHTAAQSDGAHHGRTEHGGQEQHTASSNKEHPNTSLRTWRTLLGHHTQKENSEALAGRAGVLVCCERPWLGSWGLLETWASEPVKLMRSSSLRRHIFRTSVRMIPRWCFTICVHHIQHSTSTLSTYPIPNYSTHHTPNKQSTPDNAHRTTPSTVTYHHREAKLQGGRLHSTMHAVEEGLAAQGSNLMPQPAGHNCPHTERHCLASGVAPGGVAWRPVPREAALVSASLAMARNPEKA